MKIKTLISVFVMLFMMNGNAYATSEHSGSGKIKVVDRSNKTISITHTQIKSAGMAAMTMDFKVSDPSMLDDVNPGKHIDFVFTIDSRGRYVIVDLE